MGLSVDLVLCTVENSKSFTSSERKTPFELDEKSEQYEVILGKRIQLSKFKLDGLSYSPQVRAYYKTLAKDFDDKKVGDGIGLTGMPIRFYLIFNCLLQNDGLLDK